MSSASASIPSAAAAAPSRVLALDALRGLAILGMCLSGVVPRYLPNWMYHGYYPQYLPDAAGVWGRVANPWKFHDWAAFTWVDWVFPLFLFAMGAAFPLALSRRLARGDSAWRVAGHVVWRGLVLVGFAVYVQQIIPHQIARPDSPTTTDWLLGLLGFALLFPVFTRLPRAWPVRAVYVMRFLGVAACVGLVVWIHLRKGRAFSWNDKDIIILLLAHASIVGSLVWLVTRGGRWPWRFAFLLLPALAHHQAMKPQWRLFGDTFDAWMPVLQYPKRLLDLTWIADHPLLDFSPLYDFAWYKFLWVVIPATFIGDRLLAARQTGRAALPRRGWCLLLLVSAIVLIHAGLTHHRATLFVFLAGEVTVSWLISLGAVALGVGAWGLTPRGQGLAKLLRTLTAWGTAILLLGVLVEPWEGGIKKGPPSTLSYYGVSLGLSVLLLAALVIAADTSRRGAALLRPIIAVGQNPMLAYVAIRNLLAPMIRLPLLAPLNHASVAVNHDSLDAVMQQDVLGGTDSGGRALPWLLLVWSVIQTLLLAGVTWAFTRLRVVWRT